MYGVYDPRPNAYFDGDPGGGAWVAEWGTRLWWNDSDETSGLTWERILAHWEALEADFQETYNLDLDSGVLDTRTWRWFRVRVVGLLHRNNRLSDQLGISPLIEASGILGA